MKTLRFFSIIVIFGGVSAAWWILGGTMWARTDQLDHDLSREMRSLWGPDVLVQESPFLAPRPGAERDDPAALPPASSEIVADIAHDNRYKGLLWFSTFTVDFDATYTVRAAEGQTTATFVFELPDGVTDYDRLSVDVDDKPRDVPNSQIAGGRIELPLAGATTHRVRIRYVTNGQDVWIYSPAGVNRPCGRSRDYKSSVAFVAEATPVRLSDFSLTVSTDFTDIDYPKGTRSPNEPASASDSGMSATWAFEDAVTNQPMGLAMPQRVNAGPIAMRMSFFAPVSLLFFFTVLFTVVVLKKIQLHPMHYLFIAAGSFAFHILLAYLIDKMSIHAAFWICAVVSMLLVVSYMRLVAGMKFAVVTVGAAQLVYLLGFSYAFFFPGWTGLTVVVGAIATLFVLMQSTGRVDWAGVFARRNGLKAAAVAPPPAPAEDAP
ncbi:MAG: inner membrane CreD family protein [Planctomycetota bacterium]|jgi:hypothetical protein